MADLSKKLIGKNLQNMRKLAGFKSARAFAEHMGIPVTKYTEYEQGRHSFTYEQAWEFADALGCTLDEIGGRKAPERLYADPRQAALNGHYESLNEDGKGDLVKFAKSYASDPERRIKKERRAAGNQAAMGA